MVQALLEVQLQRLTKLFLSFKSVKGDATNDTILLTHKTGAYKDVCIAMEELANGTYHRNSKGYYTFTDLMSGQKTIWDETRNSWLFYGNSRCISLTN